MIEIEFSVSFKIPSRVSCAEKLKLLSLAGRPIRVTFRQGSRPYRASLKNQKPSKPKKNVALMTGSAVLKASGDSGLLLL